MEADPAERSSRHGFPRWRGGCLSPRLPSWHGAVSNQVRPKELCLVRNEAPVVFFFRCLEVVLWSDVAVSVLGLFVTTASGVLPLAVFWGV